MTEEELAGLKTMTAREWAAVSGIKLSRILRLTREGKGPPPLRFDRKIRFRVKDIDEWMTQQANSAKTVR